ncbi:MAG: LacI family DNA-binding transcriptional regulator [Candidatus Atribacteria bacterium]|nr:LacI family DNA-binding transcriptional regulator [Candidatus Atribacteria bacterium]MCD6350164.1 LacI family DNA-binding transcriptional regulator [Candidatus Atribacteria bacterium]
MPSIKDVAKLAGVSIATVSRVINNSGKVSSEKRSRVIEAIEKLNYQPNLLARGLRQQKTRLVGCLVPDVENLVFAGLAKYIEEFLSACGYNVILCNTNNDKNKEKNYLSILIQRKVDGIIFSRVSDESILFMSSHLKRVPYVVLDRTLEIEFAPTVKLDNFLGGLLAAQHLVEMGHRRFACITGPLKIKLCRERLEGFREGLRMAGIDLREEYIFESNFKIDGGKEAALKMLAAGDLPTAIFAHNDMMAFGAIQVFRDKELSIPEDVSVVGFDNLPICELVSPPLTTVAQPFEKMAYLGVKLLDSLIKNEEVIQKTLVVKPYLVTRASTSPPRIEIKSS